MFREARSDSNAGPIATARLVILVLTLLGAGRAVFAQENSGDAVSTQPPDAVNDWLARQTRDGDSTPALSEAHVDSEDALVRRRTAPGRSGHDGRRADSGGWRSGTGGVLWPLAVVLGTIGVLAYGVRRWMSGPKGLGGDGPIKVLARCFLSNRQSLCLVRVGRRIVLVGVTPERIAAVSEITDPEEVAHFVAAAGRGGTGSFTAAMAGFTKRSVDPRELEDVEEEIAAR